MSNDPSFLACAAIGRTPVDSSTMTLPMQTGAAVQPTFVTLQMPTNWQRALDRFSVVRATRSALRAGTCSTGTYSRYVLNVMSAVLEINRDFPFQVALNFDEAASSLSQPAREGQNWGDGIAASPDVALALALP
jgi:hypothetical protein